MPTSDRKKMNIFSACVNSRFLYSLHTAWLRKATLQKVDAFQARCLRKILGIQHFFYNPVRHHNSFAGSRLLKPYHYSTATTALCGPSSAARPTMSCEHVHVFHGGTFEPRMPNGRKQRGRPRQIWLAEVYQLALDICGGRQNLECLWNLPSNVWRDNVFTHNFDRVPAQRIGCSALLAHVSVHESLA